MILILISWLFIFYMISTTGIVVKNSLNLDNHKAFIPFYGVIGQTVLFSIIAFFYKIGFEVFILNILLIVLFSYLFWSEIVVFFTSLFKDFTILQTLFFCVIILFIGFKSALLPTIFDNESYYIQTIKWLNNYGYVKGVSNVHPFLAQFSFWHVFQSGFNFSFISFHFNDSNGLMLILGLYYFFEKYTEKLDYLLVIMGLFLVFYFQFIDAPSPDLPILVICAILFYEFVFNTLDTKKSKSLFLFLVFICFIKITVAPLVLLLYFIIKKEKYSVIYYASVSLLFVSIWILKNIIITGLPLFPLSYFDLNLDWKIDSNLFEMVTQGTIDAGYSENLVYTKKLNLIQKLNLWIRLDGLNAFFNWGMIFLFLFMVFTPIFKVAKFKILYAILTIHFIFLLCTSPQYRFFLHTFILFLGLLIFEISKKIMVLRNQNLLIFMIISSLSLSVLIDIKSLKLNRIHPIQLIVPESNSKYTNISFDKVETTNFEYYNANLPSIFETSNGDLPCVSKRLLEYYKVQPKQRTTNIKDGFYTKQQDYE